MFLKLVKHELKSGSKWYFSLYILCLILALVIGLMFRSYLPAASSSYERGYLFGQSLREGSVSNLVGIFLLLSMVTFGIMMTAIALSTLTLIIKRFRESIYGKQGYLTMTLPASIHQILASKLLAGVIWIIASFIVMITSVLLIGALITFDGFPNLIQGLSTAIKSWFNSPLPYIFNDLTSIIQLLASLCLIYLAITIGHSFENRRTLISFFSFFGLLILIAFLRGLVMPTYPDYSTFSQQEMLLDTTINRIFDLVVIGASYFSMHYLIKHKLNLE